MRERERIQQEVDKILAFSSQKEWSNFLKTKGIAHKHYYHYTTLGTLNAILKSSHWQMSRVDLSNDPLENPVHSTSFTTSCLSSMGMWNMYSKLSSADDIGVRIGIPQQTFKEIFSGNKTWYSRDCEGIFHEFCTTEPEIFDMAYWHFGKSNETSVAIYRNYQLPGRALNFWFKEGDKLPSCFKSAIWRKEEEVRVCCDFTKQKNVPEKLYLKIRPEHFKQMDIRLSPAVTDSQVLKAVCKNEKFQDQLYSFVTKILGGKLEITQIQLPGEYEQWQNK